MSAETSDVSPRDRGQVRLMHEAGLSVHECAGYFGVSDAAVHRALEDLIAQHGPEKFRVLTPEAPVDQWKRQQACAVELLHKLYRLLGSLCQHPAHGRGSCIEAAWDLVDEAVWLLDPADDRPVPRVRESELRP
jgi:hypothetical protein